MYLEKAHKYSMEIQIDEDMVVLESWLYYDILQQVTSLSKMFGMCIT